ncbi:MAG: hypothetical protein HUJ68_10255, partial [Clostridia bacterium]|nr:hypothetical protein [Clostridia bacterium]
VIRELNDAINSSLDKLYERDLYLISNYASDEPNHVSERAIVFRFGVYFDELLKEKLPDYNLDSEYNRNKAEKKFLPSWEDGCFPDIIVHKRGSNDFNLLVIEFKTWWNSNQTDDKQKIQQFCSSDTYQYKYGATVLLGKTRPEVKIELFDKNENSWTSLETCGS